MLELKTIISYLSKQKIGQIDLITDPTNLDDKTKMLYNGIKDGLINTDEEAIDLIYKDPNKKETYRKLKYRLTQRLTNTIFLTDVQNSVKSEFGKSNLTLVKNWGALEILKWQGHNVHYREQVEKLLNSAIRLNRLDIAINIAKNQKIRYGIFEYNKAKYNKYKKLLAQLMSEYQLEMEAQEIYTELAYTIVHNKSQTYNEAIKDLEKRLVKLHDQASNTDNQDIKFKIYNSFYFVGMIKKDLDLMTKYCTLALEYFHSTKWNDVGIYSFTQKMGLIHLSKQEYSTALHYFNECLKYNTKPGSMRWQYHYNYKFLTQLLLKEYDQAYITISTLMNHKLFNKLKSNFKQPWYLKEALMHFLIRLGKVNPNEISAGKMRSFRLSRFLNEVQNPSSDKKGQNVTVNIIELLFLLLGNDHDKTMSKINSLKQYSFRNLKGAEHLRKRTFIKMLSKLEDGSYNRKRIEAKANNHISKLKESPMDFSEQNLQIEIMPYEQLWSEIMYLLEIKHQNEYIT